MLSWISGGSNNTNHEICYRQCSLNGYLYKMKRERKLLVPQWNKRWFSIEGRFFRWYENPNSEEASGSIDLKKVSYITRFEMQGAYSFIIGYPDRNLMLRAETSEGMDKWMRALQLQADVARGGNGTNIISGGIPSSPASRRSSKKKSSSLEAELDRSLRQLQDLERQIQSKTDDISSDFSSSNRNSIQSFPKDHSESSESSLSSINNQYQPYQPITYVSSSNSTNMNANVGGSFIVNSNSASQPISRRSSKNINNSINISNNNNNISSSSSGSNNNNIGNLSYAGYDSSITLTSNMNNTITTSTMSDSKKENSSRLRTQAHEPILSYKTTYPHLDDDAPKTGDIVKDVVDKSIYTSLTHASSKSGRNTPSVNSFSRPNSAAKLGKSDSHESLEEIIDRPIRRVNSKTRTSRTNSHEGDFHQGSDKSMNSKGSGRMPTSQPPTKMTSSKYAVIGSTTPGSTTTDEETVSGRSTNSQHIPESSYRSNSGGSISSYRKLDYKSDQREDNTNYSDINPTDTSDFEVQEVDLKVRQVSKRTSQRNNIRQSFDSTSAW